MSVEPRPKRSEHSYVIDAGLRMLKVLEALKGMNFEPVSIARVVQRSGFSYDFCRRALITLKRGGFATESPDGWQVGPKLMQFAQNFNDVCLAALTQENSEIAETNDS